MSRHTSVIKAELDDAKTQRDAYENRVLVLQRELNEALIGSASHDWLGKRVVRTYKRFSRDKARTERGTVTAYDPAKHCNLRCLSTYDLEAGDPIVVHDSGITGWRLIDRWEPKPFQIEEGQSQ